MTGVCAYCFKSLCSRSQSPTDLHQQFLCRIFSAPSKKEYIKDAFNWADVASAMGLPLRVSIGLVMQEPGEEMARATVQATLIYVLPTVRFLKLDALPVLMYTCHSCSGLTAWLSIVAWM
eukprot:Skav228244  [mRNA]  locus=scaffold3112:178671:180689:+ [translate_table: standard]